jgi:hypothetical protein
MQLLQHAALAACSSCSMQFLQHAALAACGSCSMRRSLSDHCVQQYLQDMLHTLAKAKCQSCYGRSSMPAIRS